MTAVNNQVWKVLVADDEEEVHVVTKMVLSGLNFENRGIELYSVYSARETIEFLKTHPDISVLLLDVVMDGEEAGLEAVKQIRTELDNQLLRIILRTGQPGRAPESKVVTQYDINDYKEKTELTSLKLKSAIISALRSYRDLSALEENRVALRKAQDYVNDVINGLNTAVIGLNAELKIDLWNDVSSDISGAKAGEVLGEKLDSLKNGFEIISHAANEVLHTNEPVFFGDFTFTHKPGCLYQVAVLPLSTLEAGVVVRIEDVTALREKEQQLQRSQKLEAVGTLAAGLAHDLNNILGGITGAVSLMEFERESEPEKHNPSYDSSLDTITESAKRASGLVQQLLSLTRQKNAHKEVVEINDAVERVYKVCKSSFEKTIILKRTLSPEPLYTMANYTQLEQVLLNLCINAAHAMTIMRAQQDAHEGGELTITVNKVNNAILEGYPDAVCISIEDQGVGIPEENLQRIFNPFFTTKTSGAGTGLGLVMVHSLLKSFGGEITLESEVNRGTKVEIYLPLIDPEEIESEEKKTAVQKGQGGILVCDDEAIMRKISERLLTKLGYDVLLAKDGLEAVEKFKSNQEKISLVVLDFLMPKMSGIEVFEALRELNPEVKIILSSGYKDDERLRPLVDQGVKFLQKPYTIEKLSKALKEVLGAD
jgi:two-component system cell cycle sensor histidine kinase/response regulator CckA